MIQFDQLQKFSREATEATVTSLGALTTGTQAAAGQIADYARQSFELGGQTAQRMLGARSLEAAMQVQGDYLRTSYEGMVAQVSRLGELATDTAKQAFAPVEGFASRSLRAAG